MIVSSLCCLILLKEVLLIVHFEVLYQAKKITLWGFLLVIGSLGIEKKTNICGARYSNLLAEFYGTFNLVFGARKSIGKKSIKGEG